MQSATANASRQAAPEADQIAVLQRQVSEQESRLAKQQTLDYSGIGPGLGDLA